jgi:nicotinamide-nucleotide amidase
MPFETAAYFEQRTEVVNAKELDFARIDEHLINRAIETLDALARLRLRAVAAESCTGGLVAAVLSEAPGAAEYFEGGFVVYTPGQKSAALNVSPMLIKEEGTVSRAVALAMAEGALRASNADIAISVTGVAGPDPDENTKRKSLKTRAVRRLGLQPL